LNKIFEEIFEENIEEKVLENRSGETTQFGAIINLCTYFPK